jgi:hypothetical protein
MDTITIDGMDEHDFRHGIEDMLRADEGGQAIEKLRELLKPYAGYENILPPRFLDVTSADIEFGGWNKLANRLPHHDRPGFVITAIGVVLADSRALGGPGPENGRLAPFVKTFYFSDDAYPFTNATRDDLLDGYTREGFGWQGDYQATDATLSIKGIDELYGTIVELEDRLLDSKNPNEDEIRAGTIGACFLAALIHQALRDTIRKAGLPRPLCVLAACDGVYPFFDAPVVGQDESTVAAAAEDARESVADGAAIGDAENGLIELPAPEGSLLDVAPRKHSKTMALMLDDEGNQDAARYAEMAAARRMEAGAERELIGVLSDTEHDPAAVFEPEQMLLDSEDLAMWDEEGLEAEADPTEECHEAEEALQFPSDLPDPLKMAAAVPEPMLEVAASNSFRARLKAPVAESQESARDWKGHLPAWLKRLVSRFSL